MNDTIAILGASGFIGRHTLDRFSREKVDILGCNIHGGKVGTMNVEPVDLTREDSLSSWLVSRDIDAIIYLASEIPQSFSNVALSIFDNNIKMHRNVLKFWIQSNCHLIYASTCAVYGSSGSLPWREENAPVPENYYSTSKLVGELLFRTPHLDGHQLTILRLNAPFGVGGRKTVINVFLENALSGRTIKLFGTGQRGQDFLHVSDIANAFWLAYSTGVEGTFNIASGKTVTMKQLAESVIKVAKSSSRFELSGTPDSSENVKVQIDISKARKRLGFKPAYSLDRGLKECIREYSAVKMC